MKYIIYFDGECSYCRLLASFIVNRYSDLFDKMPLKKSNPIGKEGGFHIKNPNTVQEPKLRIFDGTAILEDLEAWKFLVQNYPDIKGFLWIAKKIGLKNDGANALKKLGKGIRFFCRSCRKRI